MDGKFIFRGVYKPPFGWCWYYISSHFSSASIVLTELLTCFVNNLPNSLLAPKRSTYLWQCVSFLRARFQIKALCVTLSLYERRSKTHLFLVSNRISKADFDCALTAVAKGSRRSCERSAQVMLVTWPRCKNNCSSDFRLLFPGLGKSKLEI